MLCRTWIMTECSHLQTYCVTEFCSTRSSQDHVVTSCISYTNVCNKVMNLAPPLLLIDQAFRWFSLCVIQLTWAGLSIFSLILGFYWPCYICLFFRSEWILIRPLLWGDAKEWVQTFQVEKRKMCGQAKNISIKKTMLSFFSFFFFTQIHTSVY